MIQLNASRVRFGPAFRGFLLKLDTTYELIRALTVVGDGGIYVSPRFEDDYARKW